LINHGGIIHNFVPSPFLLADLQAPLSPAPTVMQAMFTAQSTMQVHFPVSRRSNL